MRDQFAGQAVEVTASASGTSTITAIQAPEAKQVLGLQIVAKPKIKYRDVHLQGLRGLAMGLVFLGHFTGSYLQVPGDHAYWIRLLQSITSAQFGSTTFLMIAGFALYGRAQRDSHFEWKPYLQARLLRIIPLYWFALAVKAAWELSCGRHRIPADNGQAILYLLQNALLLFPFTQAAALITVSWTIAYLFIGYLSVPAIVQIAKRWSLDFSARIASIILFAVFWIVVPMLSTRLGWNGLGLALGMLISEVSGKWPVRTRMANRLDLAAPSALIAACAFLLGLQNKSIVFSARPISYFAFIVVASLPVCLLFAGRLATGGLLNRLLATKFFVWLGDVSFSFYLFHGLALMALKALLRMPEIRPLLAGQTGYLLALSLGYLGALAAAAGIHYFVELPLNAAIARVPVWSKRCLRRLNQSSPQAEPVLSSRRVLAKYESGRYPGSL